MLLETTEADLEEHLRAVGLGPGMDVVVHSRLIAFGRIKDAAATTLTALRRVLGGPATLFSPTYTFACSASVPYDPRSTPSNNVCVLERLREPSSKYMLRAMLTTME